jgi:hypothetical protein
MQRSGGSGFEASLGKWFERPYLKKTHHQKKRGGAAGGATQGVSPEFKPQYQKKSSNYFSIYCIKI